MFEFHSQNLWYNKDALLTDRIGQRWRATRAVCQICGEGGASASSFSLPSLETNALNSGGSGAEPPFSLKTYPVTGIGYSPVVT